MDIFLRCTTLPPKDHFIIYSKREYQSVPSSLIHSKTHRNYAQWDLVICNKSSHGVSVRVTTTTTGKDDGRGKREKVESRNSIYRWPSKSHGNSHVNQLEANRSYEVMFSPWKIKREKMICNGHFSSLEPYRWIYVYLLSHVQPCQPL